MLEQIFTVFLFSLGCVCFIMAIWNFYMFFKCDNAYKNSIKILEAINAYNDYVGWDKTKLILFSDMEALETTINRFWDWGYTRILPQDKFELIKPFIRK